MGNCCSGEKLSAEEQARRKAEAANSKRLEKDMTQDHHADQQINKLLLLGAGESGQSQLSNRQHELAVAKTSLFEHPSQP